MFRHDHRVILRRFEFERLFVPFTDGAPSFGGRYSDRLLESFFATDARKLDRTIGRLNETQRTLYAVNAFCGQIDNGGISQFFFNSPPVLRSAVHTALEHLGASDMLRKYSEMLERFQRDESLGRIRSAAEGWDDYLAFKRELNSEDSATNTFDDWYFAGQQEILDRLMRQNLAGREHDVVRFCDGHPRLEARWTRELLGRLVSAFEWYQVKSPSGIDYGFFDLLITPERRPHFGGCEEERRKSARSVAVQLMPAIRRAARRARFANYAERPSPQITIKSGHNGKDTDRLIASFHDDGSNLMWSISGW